MVYNCVCHYPLGDVCYLTEDQKIERTKEMAAKDLAKELLKYATYGVNPDGSVWVKFEI